MDEEIGRPPGMTLRLIGFDVAQAFSAQVRADCAAHMSPTQARFERSYLGNLGLYQFYRAEFYGVYDENDTMAALHVASFGTSPRKNAWGRYVNHYLAYTHPARRAQGFGSHGELDLQAQAFERGYDRLKTLCQSWLGVLYHGRLHDLIWGVNDKGELVVDSPLHPGPWPDGCPIKARKWNTTGAEMTDDDFYQVLTDPDGRFQASPGHAAVAVYRRRERRGQGFEPARGDEPSTRPEPGAISHSATPPRGDG